MSKQPENDNEAREELAKMIVELSNKELEELAGGSSFISYDALRSDVVTAFVRFGKLIFPTSEPANPYTRGCGPIERCRG